MVPVTLLADGGGELKVTVDLGPVVAAISARLEAMLARSLARLEPGPSHEEALDVPGAAMRLGISQAAVWRLIRTGELDSLKVGARRVIPSSAIDAFLQRR